MALKSVLFGLCVLVMAKNSQCFFFGPILNFFAGGIGNGTSIFGNSTDLNNTVFNLIDAHIAHTVGSLASIAEIAELLAAQKLLASDFAAQYATNVSSAIGVALSNYTSAKFNITNEAAQTVINAGTELFALGVEAAALKPALGLGIAGAFRR